jgi:hypothetical protein
MAKTKVDDYVTTEAAPEPKENYGDAIASKTQNSIAAQVRGAVADIEVMEDIRRRALSELSARIAAIVDPDQFTADLYSMTAGNLSGRSLAYTPVFGEVAIDVESIRVPVVQRPSVSDFLALPAGNSSQTSLNGGYSPLALEGGDYADD